MTQAKHTTKQQAIKELDNLGMELDESVTGRIGGSWSATIDAKGRNSFAGECMGQCVHNYTATSDQFWQEVIDRAKEHAGTIEPCPHPVGECDFHDEIPAEAEGGK